MTYISQKIKNFLTHKKTLGIVDVFVAYASSFVTLLIFSKILPKEEFGLYGLCMSVFLMFCVFESFFQTATIKYCTTQDKDLLTEMISTLLWLKGLAFIVAGGVLFMARPFIVSFYGLADMSGILVLFPLLLVFKMLFEHGKSILKARENVNELLVQDLIFAVTFIGLSVGLRLSITKAVHVFVIFLVAHAVSLVFLAGRNFALLRITSGLNKAVARKIFDYGKYTVLVGIGMLVYQNTDILMIGKLSSVDEVGVYKIGRVSAMLVLILTQGFMLTLMSQLARLNEEGLIAELKRIYFKHIRVMLMIFCAFFVLSVLFAKPLFGFFFQEKYLGGEVIFIIFAFSGIVRAIGNPQGALLSGVGLVKYDSFQMWASMGMNVVLNLLLIPRFGGVGAAISTICALSVGCVLKEIWIRKHFFARQGV